MQETAAYMPNVSAIGDHDMPDNIPTEEQNSKVLVNRIIRYGNAEALIAIAGYLTVIVCLMSNMSKNYPCAFGIFIFSTYVLYRIIRKLLVGVIARGSSTPEEFEVAMGDGLKDNPFFQEALAEKLKLSVRHQLLRASQPTESGDTLLRAATSTDETPQDQLLRPTDNAPNTLTP